MKKMCFSQILDKAEKAIAYLVNLPFRQDTRHVDTQNNDIQHNDTQHNDIQHRGLILQNSALSHCVSSDMLNVVMLIVMSPRYPVSNNATTHSFIALIATPALITLICGLSDICAKRHLRERHLCEVGLREEERERERDGSIGNLS